MTAQTTPNAGPERPDHVSELLADRLGRLRDARPGFQAELEARLLDQLPAGRPR